MLFFRNRSVYEIAFGELSGPLQYLGPISGTAQWITVPLRLVSGQRDDCYIRFTFDDAKDAIVMLNQHTGLGLHHLKSKVTTTPQTATHDFNLDCLANVERLRDLYPKIETTIHEANISTHYEFKNGGIEDSLTGIFVNVRLTFINPRPGAITIESFKLDTEPYLQRITLASAGELFTKCNVIKNKVHPDRPLTPNLRNNLPIVAERGVPIEGWLQFYLRGVSPQVLLNQTPTIVIVDSFGEEHTRGTTPLIKNEVEAR